MKINQYTMSYAGVSNMSWFLWETFHHRSLRSDPAFIEGLDAEKYFCPLFRALRTMLSPLSAQS
jgi:hypothetical protein